MEWRARLALIGELSCHHNSQKRRVVAHSIKLSRRGSSVDASQCNISAGRNHFNKLRISKLIGGKHVAPRYLSIASKEMMKTSQNMRMSRKIMGRFLFWRSSFKGTSF